MFGIGYRIKYLDDDFEYLEINLFGRRRATTTVAASDLYKK